MEAVLITQSEGVRTTVRALLPILADVPKVGVDQTAGRLFALSTAITMATAHCQISAHASVVGLAAIAWFLSVRKSVRMVACVSLLIPASATSGQIHSEMVG